MKLYGRHLNAVLHISLTWSDVLSRINKITEIADDFISSVVDQSQYGKMGRDVPNLKKKWSASTLSKTLLKRPPSNETKLMIDFDRERKEFSQD